MSGASLVKAGLERHDRTNGTIYFGCNPAGASVGAQHLRQKARRCGRILGASAGISVVKDDFYLFDDPGYPRELT